MPHTRGMHGEDRAAVDHWLESLGRLARLTLRLDADGVCAIGHASGLDCVIEAPGNGCVYFRVPLLPWEPEQDPDLAERCLVAQFMGQGTQGASFGVDPDDGELVLWRERPIAAMDEQAFHEQVAQLIASALQWRSGLPAAKDQAQRLAAINAERPAHFSSALKA